MNKILSISIALLSLFCLSCEEEKNAKIEVWLTDAPGDFQEVNISLQAVEIHSSPTDNEKGWRSLDITEGTYDLLKLTNGTETLLGDLELPGGRISQIRLKLGEANTVKIDDLVYPLSTPSAQQSGLKIQINEILAEGITYKILLDFDAAKSVVHNGNGSYSLKPVIRAITKAQDGAIKGVITPAGTTVSVAAILDAETVATTFADENGNFLFRGLNAGSYTIVFDAGSNFPVVEKTGVSVELGNVTDMGSVEIAE